ncbi:hypothetical protein EBR21_13935 [bacterium]|nr:hypothetical protein [bacterium]
MMPVTANQNLDPKNASEFCDAAPALLIVRISAIGDTILAARTHQWAREKGYRPFLVTHANNVSLLDCMPLLAGACLVDERGLKYLLRRSNAPGFDEVDTQRFAQALAGARGTTIAGNNLKLGSTVQLADLQATRRSRRAIEELKSRLAAFGLSVQRYEVSKITFWRILLVVWSFLNFRQQTSVTPPAWIRNKLLPVHRLQKNLLDRLPALPVIYGSIDKQPALTHPSANRAANFGLDPQSKCVVLLLGSSHKLKSWPQAHFRKLIELILTRTSLKIVLCGGPDDRLVASWLSFLDSSRIVDLVGKTPLSETLSLIQKASYVVTGDSFASHAADLLGTPASVLFGATHPLLGFAPERPHVTVHHKGLSCSPCSRHGQGECRFKNIRCLTTITPEEVFTKIEQVLVSGSQKVDSQLTVD